MLQKKLNASLSWNFNKPFSNETLATSKYPDVIHFHVFESFFQAKTTNVSNTPNIAHIPNK